jgi:hydrogenase nickel incorporation protein HypA/HybF
MHELSIMEQVLEIALEKTRQQGASQIHYLKMRVGEMSGVVAEALQFAFDVATEMTAAEGAIFEIETVPVICYCESCQVEFQPTDLFYECPQCGQLSADIRQGREIELSSLEIS